MDHQSCANDFVVPSLQGIYSATIFMLISRKNKTNQRGWLTQSRRGQKRLRASWSTRLLVLRRQAHKPTDASPTMARATWNASSRDLLLLAVQEDITAADLRHRLENYDTRSNASIMTSHDVTIASSFMTNENWIRFTNVTKPELSPPVVLAPQNPNKRRQTPPTQKLNLTKIIGAKHQTVLHQLCLCGLWMILDSGLSVTEVALSLSTYTTLSQEPATTTCKKSGRTCEIQ
jgi:hypothetical protein